MYCCANCFVSPTLKEHIKTDGTDSVCDFCSSKNVKCVRVSDLNEFFEPIFGMYREIEYGKDYFKGDDPISHGELLPDLIENDWYPIFSDDFDENMLDDFWNALVKQEWVDKDYPPIDLSALCVMKEGSFENYWGSFSDYLKNERRFTIEREDLQHFTEFLPELLSGIEVKVKQGEEYFRARLGSGDKTEPFPKEEMGSPPPEKTLTGGRANPPGIPFLYLSDNENTSIAEVRPWKGATASVAKFFTTKEITLIDLTQKFYIKDVFGYGENLPFVVEDQSLLRRLGRELSKPVSPNKINIEYIPTQYVTEIVRNLKYDGMIYPSTLGKDKNIVLFDENAVQCEEVKLHQVKAIDYSSSEYDPWDEFEM